MNAFCKNWHARIVFLDTYLNLLVILVADIIGLGLKRKGEVEMLLFTSLITKAALFPY